jgi:hypothetical protein
MIDDDYDPYIGINCPHGFTGFCPACEARHNPRYGFYDQPKSEGHFNDEGDYFEPNCRVHQGHTNMNWYSSLNIQPPTSLKQIKKAYYKMALQTHPDKGGSDEEFKKVQEAYEELSAIYD